MVDRVVCIACVNCVISVKSELWGLFCVYIKLLTE